MQGGLGGGTVSMRPGIDAGESYVREVAAYMLVRYIYTSIIFFLFPRTNVSGVRSAW